MPPDLGSPTSTEEVGQFVRDLLEAWNTHDIERIKAFYAPEYEGVDVSQAEPQQGQRGISRSVERYLRAFPDLCFVEEEIVVQGNRAVLVWTAHGTHGGKLMRIPPTGRKIEVRGTSVLTVENAKVTRGLYVWDRALRGHRPPARTVRFDPMALSRLTTNRRSEQKQRKERSDDERNSREQSG